MKKKKVIVIGLDCATPKTLFEDFKDTCPNIKKMLDNGIYGALKSSDPPITIPAWMVMSTGKKAGTLGLYGFRHRKQNSYNEYWIANSYNIREPKIWDILSKKGLKSIILGVPPTYPIQKIEGYLISGFITPDINVEFTYPPELKEEIKNNVGNYVLDANFRTENKADLLVEINQMTKIHFKTLKYLIKNKEWDYCQFVIIGLDRMHHAFWKYYDKSHQKYEPGNLFESAMKNFYKMIDKEVGEILELLDEDTTVIIASDHGAKAMEGCLCVNMALESLGLLSFKSTPAPKTKLQDADIDWSKTYAWGWGGYYARIFLNMIGREKNGIIPPEDYDLWREKISESLKSIKKPDGTVMKTIVYKPEELYDSIKGDYPDLMVYFDDLNWRSAGTVGYDSMYLDENDTGPDDAVHDYYGVFVIYDPKKSIGKRLKTRNILDIAPTILKIFGFDIPEDMEGKIIDFNQT
ncbi:MAG: alkaline phosphatase family protein [Candidatus Lokiarchaeota archaeon]|nr:alkaline phosphatase family protein [Candidatus Lokiarchaeota archaeon]